MNHPDDIGNTARNLFDQDEVEGVLSGSFYTSPNADHRGAQRIQVVDKPLKTKTKAKKAKPDHYKVICISMYLDALAELDEKVKELKRRGYTKANRSALIRHALSVVDLDKVPRGI